MATGAPRLMDAEPVDVFLPAYLGKAGRERYGADWKYKSQYQRRGTCVGQSHKTGADITLAVARYVCGMKFPGRCAVATVYAGSRVEIGRSPGRWDGSNGSWAAEWYTQYGVVLLSELNLPEDSLGEDENLATSWAASREGVPQKFEEAAHRRPITNAPLVTTPEEVRAALRGLNFVNICSSLIPGGRRNSDGVSRMGRQGGHSTGIVGCRRLRGGEWVYAYMQSWGPWASGPYGWSKFDPQEEFSHCIVDITEGDLSAVLRSRDCYALIGPQGLEPVDPEFFI